MMNKKRKSVLFIADGDDRWIGGLYYVKNMLYMFLNNEELKEEFNIYVAVSEKNKESFYNLRKYGEIKFIVRKEGKLNKLIWRVTNKILKRPLDFEIYKICKINSIDFIYPVSYYPYLGLKKECIYWIPDFQHIHLPRMFQSSELKRRNRIYEYMAINHKKLILSSQDAFNDYKSLYPNHTENVYVVNFISYIKDELNQIDNEYVKKTLNKYNINYQYIYTPNQFWQHKNHIIVFKAINYIVKNLNIDIKLICTGSLNEPRNLKHINELLNYIEENNLQDNIIILGFLERKEQLVIMKKAKFIIQPSLFEGWGTVVEDAKAINKRILMSNIDVHQEQKDNNCIIFDRNDYVDLANKIMVEYNSKSINETFDVNEQNLKVCSSMLRKVFNF